MKQAIRPLIVRLFLDRKKHFLSFSYLICTWYTNTYGCIAPVSKDLLAKWFTYENNRRLLCHQLVFVIS